MASRTIELAKRMERLRSSKVVTDVLELAERPEVISLAGGLPDPAVFPLERVRESMARVLLDEGAEALNYGPNPGFTKLREWIGERMGTHENVRCSVDEVLVTSGGIEGLNLVSMALLDEGDSVVVEAPTYLAALHVFRACGARIVSVPVDEKGLDPNALEETLDRLAKEGAAPRFVYTIPSFQNPAGCTMPEDRRRKIAALAGEREVLLVEDHAYAELAYDGPRLPSLKSLAPERVVLLHTFSKIFGPGVRLGWAAATPELVEQLGLCKLGTDQCANTLTQRLVFDYGSRGYIDDQVRGSIELYRRKRDRMEEAMRRHLPESASWVHPEGGFFVWVRLEGDVDSVALLRTAIDEHQTAFVAGPPFYDDGSGRNELRLSFSYVPEGKIEEGVARIARALAES